MFNILKFSIGALFGEAGKDKYDEREITCGYFASTADWVLESDYSRRANLR